MNLELLRNIRIARKVRQAEIAFALGYKSKSAYCSMETGVHGIRADQIPVIAKCLSMTDEEKLAVFFPD